MDDRFIIKGIEFKSRLWVGTGKYKDFDETARVIEASGANQAIRACFDYVSYAGRVVFTGWPKSDTELPRKFTVYR